MAKTADRRRSEAQPDATTEHGACVAWGLSSTPIITRETIALGALGGKTLAVDGNVELYQFLALIRLPDGTPLQDSNGRITSHLSGLFFRTTRLMSEHRLRLVFVFDGTPPPRKAREIAKRRASRARYEEERAAALASGDIAQAYSKATMTSRLTREMIAEARELLRLMGVPTLQAPPKERRRRRTWPRPRRTCGPRRARTTTRCCSVRQGWSAS